jgi:hypothetical protein
VRSAPLRDLLGQVVVEVGPHQGRREPREVVVVDQFGERRGVVGTSVVWSLLRNFARDSAAWTSSRGASRIVAGEPKPESTSSRHARVPSSACTRPESSTARTSRR